MPTTIEPFFSPSFIKKLVVGVLLLNLLVYTGTSYSLYLNWQQKEADIVTTTSNIAGLLENTISGIFGKADTVLKEVVDVAKSARLDSTFMANYLKRHSSMVPEIDSIVIADKDGFLLNGSEINGITPINISDREHFTLVRDTTEEKLFISNPYQSRISKQWRINIGRRFNRPDGAFGGVENPLPGCRVNIITSKTIPNMLECCGERFVDCPLYLNKLACSDPDLSEINNKTRSLT